MFFINRMHQPHRLNVTLKGHLVSCHIIIFAMRYELYLHMQDTSGD